LRSTKVIDSTLHDINYETGNNGIYNTYDQRDSRVPALSQQEEEKVKRRFQTWTIEKKSKVVPA
jgi:hypothetical protein